MPVLTMCTMVNIFEAEIANKYRDEYLGRFFRALKVPLSPPSPTPPRKK